MSLLARVVRLVPQAACSLLLLMLPPAFAVTLAQGADMSGDYLVDVWTPENGLPDSSVTAIAQTPDGYLWIGTYNGLVRFDGVHFVTFDPANAPALKHARVRQLYVDNQGLLWINTYGGSLTTLHQGTFSNEIARANSSEADLTLVSSSSNQVVFLTSRGNILRKSLDGAGASWRELMSPKRGLDALCCEDGQGTVWYLGNDKHLWRLLGDRFEPLSKSAGLAGHDINCLTTDANGRLWIGTDSGFGFWDGTVFQDATPTNSEAIPGVTSLAITSDAHVWAVAGGCVCEAVDRRWILKPAPARNLFPGNPGHIGMQEDHHGGMWFYNYGRGLIHINAGGDVRQLASEDGFPGLRVYCFFEDREGNWWAGLDSGGLVRVRERQFHSIAASDGPLAKAAKSVSEDARGTVWVGSLNGGLGCWQNGTFTNLNLTGTPDVNSIFCACADDHGRLWISAGDDENLYVYEGGKIRSVSPVIHGVKAIIAGHDGRVWVGTKSGLYFADPPGNFQIYKDVPKHYVRALAEDAAGILWAGTGNGDLYRVDGDAVTTFHPTDSDTSEAIWSILPDREQKGTVWVGTFRGGLLRFQDGKFTRYGKTEGLPDNVICQILEDSHTNLWLGSHQGIFRVAKSALEKVASGETNFVPCIVYGRSDGLPSLECSGGYQPAAWNCRDGTLWFTTVKGAVWIQPERIQSNLLPPPVVIEEVLLDGRTDTNLVSFDPVRTNARNVSPPVLEIPPGRHQIEIRYTGLSLVSPERVQFRYLLDGVDADWVQAGTQRFAQYNFLPPGEYFFHVVACNSDGIWNETGSALTLKILPHLYETWWFHVLTGMVVIGMVAGVVRTTVTRRLRQKMERLERQQAVERERARIAKDIHDDLGASLNLIAVLGDLAKKEKAVERIEKMSSTAREAVKSLDEIVWAVNPRNDTLSNLIDYICQFATDYLRAAGIRCLLDVPEQTPAREVPANVRHNLFLVVKEALQNIVKHAHATQVGLRITVNGQGLRIEVEDNGGGFEGTPADAGADGLNNMRQRLAEIGGECQIQSRVGAGTTVAVGICLSS